MRDKKIPDGLSCGQSVPAKYTLQEHIFNYYPTGIGGSIFEVGFNKNMSSSII
jgi:hypothetical protein